MRDAARDDKVTKRGVTSGGDARGNNDTIDNAEPIRGSEGLRGKVPISPKDPRTFERFERNGHFMEDVKVPSRETFRIFEIDGTDVNTSASDTTNPSKGSTMLKGGWDDVLVRRHTSASSSKRGGSARSTTSHSAPGRRKPGIPLAAPQLPSRTSASGVPKKTMLLQKEDVRGGALHHMLHSRGEAVGIGGL